MEPNVTIKIPSYLATAYLIASAMLLTKNSMLKLNFKKALFEWTKRAFFYKICFVYNASDTTSFTSGTILCNKLWIPDFKVIVDDGQPLQEPLSSTVTIPSSKDL